MTVAVKICGLRDADSVAATVAGGARYAGFVFYPKSPRAVTPEQAAALIATLPDHIIPVGLFVDPTDDQLAAVLGVAKLGMIQLHGSESPQRTAAIKHKTVLPIIKAVGIATPQDVALARTYEPVADMLLLDAKPAPNALPGGNAAMFDWKLLKNISFFKPWMLAGGLNSGNLAAAVAMTGARIVDVSSGVEDAPGHKNTGKIKAFLDLAAQIETCC